MELKLKEVMEWAQSIDVSKIEEKKRHHAQCYKSMILEKISLISKNSEKIHSYMNDLTEYVAQLGKIGVMLHPEEKEEAPKEELSSESTKSPLLP